MNNVEELAKDLYILAKDYHNYMAVGDYLLNSGEQYISNNDYSAGITFIKSVDELCAEVNSGGFESYLYYNGNHFQDAVTSLKKLQAVEMLLLMKTIQDTQEKTLLTLLLDYVLENKNYFR